MASLEDVGRVPGGDMIRQFLSVGHNDNGTVKTVVSSLPAIFDVTDAAYGAVADGWYVEDANISATSKTLTTTTSTPFTAGMVGMSVNVSGAGATAADSLQTTIAAFTNSKTVTLAAAASTSVTNGVAAGGTDNTAAFQAAAAAVASVGQGELWVPYTGTGMYYCIPATHSGGYTVVIPGTSNLMVRGIGYPTILTPAQNSQNYVIRWFGTCSNARVTGLKFNGCWPNLIYGGSAGVGGTGEITHHCVMADGTSITGLKVDNCFFQGFGSKCVQVNGSGASSRVWIKDNVFYNSTGNQWGLSATGAASITDFEISGNIHYLCGAGVGVEAFFVQDGCNRGTIHDNFLYDNELHINTAGNRLDVHDNVMIRYGPTLQLGQSTGGDEAVGWMHNYLDAVDSTGFKFRGNHLDVSVPLSAGYPVPTIYGGIYSWGLVVQRSNDFSIEGNTIVTDNMTTKNGSSTFPQTVGILLPTPVGTPAAASSAYSGASVRGNRVIGGQIFLGYYPGSAGGSISNIDIADNIVDGTIECKPTNAASGLRDMSLRGNQFGIGQAAQGDTTWQHQLCAWNLRGSHNVFRGNGIGSIGTIGTALTVAALTENEGWNPVGKKAPTFPATGIEYANLYGSRAIVYIAGGTVTAISIGLPTPRGSYDVVLSTATTGGSLAGSTTYYYRMSATNAAGETLASTEQSIAVPAGTSTNTVTLNWVLVPGATGYKIYGRSTGAELLMATITNGLTTSWIDTGSVTPSGALPGSNTTGVATGVTSGPVLVQTGQAIIVTYTGSPTWVWMVE